MHVVIQAMRFRIHEVVMLVRRLRLFMATYVQNFPRFRAVIHLPLFMLPLLVLFFPFS
jgi:hypothetical protein